MRTIKMATYLVTYQLTGYSRHGRFTSLDVIEADLPAGLDQATALETAGRVVWDFESWLVEDDDSVQLTDLTALFAVNCEEDR